MCINSAFSNVKFAIAFAFAIFSVDCIQNSYQNITDCVYYPGKIGSIVRNNTLKFICSEHDAFDSNGSLLFKTSTCRDQFLCGDKCKNHSPKFLVDTIVFENCALARLPPDLLGTFNQTKALNAINLGLTELDRVDFTNATRLIKFVVSHNKLTTIPANLLNHSKQIEIADFSHNQIGSFDGEIFGDENQLKVLNVSFNNIVDLSTMPFQRLEKLERLQLSHNQIHAIQAFQFQNMVHLNEVDISFNQIEMIEELAFVGDFPRLRILHLSHNRLNHTEFIGEMANLTYLDVSANQITILPAHTFQECRNLQYLDVSRNPIELIGSDTFVLTTKLLHLNLSSTLLSAIQPNTFVHLRNLRILDVSNCRLKRLNRNVLPSHLKLQLLSIANNQLTELSGFTTENIHNTIIHGIDSNQFNCTYLHQFLLSFVWKQFGSNYVWFNCNSSTKKQNDEGETNAKTQSNGLESAIANRKGNDEADDDDDDELLSLKKYLFVLISVMVIGFITIALVFVALILRVGVCNHHHRQPAHPHLYYANNYFARPPKFIGDNHIYDIIDDDSKWI